MERNEKKRRPKMAGRHVSGEKRKREEKKMGKRLEIDQQGRKKEKKRKRREKWARGKLVMDKRKRGERGQRHVSKGSKRDGKEVRGRLVERKKFIHKSLTIIYSVLSSSVFWIHTKIFFNQIIINRSIFIHISAKARAARSSPVVS